LAPLGLVGSVSPGPLVATPVGDAEDPLELPELLALPELLELLLDPQAAMTNTATATATAADVVRANFSIAHPP
jgi:hypothetical protein